MDSASHVQVRTSLNLKFSCQPQQECTKPNQLHTVWPKQTALIFAWSPMLTTAWWRSMADQCCLKRERGLGKGGGGVGAVATSGWALAPWHWALLHWCQTHCCGWVEAYAWNCKNCKASLGGLLLLVGQSPAGGHYLELVWAGLQHLRSHHWPRPPAKSVTAAGPRWHSIWPATAAWIPG